VRAVQHNEPNTAATGSLYDFWPDYPDKVLIIINYFAVQHARAESQFVTRDEALAHETGGVEH
jgi:hypothetical protein